MPTVGSTTNDGYVESQGSGTWASVRDAGTGTSFANTGYGGGYDIGTKGKSVGDAGQYEVRRAFLSFNTKGVNNIDTATISLYGNASGGGNCRIVKGSADVIAAGLSTADFDSISGFTAGASMAGNVTDYVDSAFALTNGITNVVTLNSTAINDMNANDKFNICIVGDDYDYQNVDPGLGGENNAAITFTEFPLVAYQPTITYTTSSTPAGRAPLAGGTFDRTELRNKSIVATQLDADTDYEFLLKNDLKSQVYFTIEGGKGLSIFESASIRTTTSDSGSNVLRFVTGSNLGSGIINADCTASFLVSSSVTIEANSFKVIATNPQVFSIEDITASGSVFGVDLSIEV